MSEHPEPQELPRGWSVRVLSPSDPAFVAAEAVEHDVFAQENFITPSPQRRVGEYEAYRGISTFHAVVAPDGSVMGCVRTLLGPWRELPVGKFAPEGWTPEEVLLEYASLAVTPDCRGVGIAEALYRSVWIEGRRSPANGLAAIVEAWLFELLRDTYGFGFSSVGQARWYMGGDCLPVVAPFGELERRLPRERVRLWEYLCRPVPPEELASWGVDL